MTRGFARFGKWFTQPLTINPNEKKPNDPTTQLSFSFKFFVHGDSTICTSLDVRQHAVVHRLNKLHLSTAQSSQNGLKVILGPYGLLGCLTGQTFKDGDPSVSKILTDWKRFYPLNTGPKDSQASSIPRFESSPEIRSTQGVSSPPALVEVVVSGIKMKYPSCYTFVPLETNETVNPCSNNCKEVISKTQTDRFDPVLKKVTTPRLSPYCCTDPPADFNLRYGAFQDIGSSSVQVKTITNPDNLFWEIIDTSVRLTCPTSRCKSARKGGAATAKFGGVKIPGKTERPTKKHPFHKRISQTSPDENDIKSDQQLIIGQSKTHATKSPGVGGVPSNASTPECIDSPRSAVAPSEEPGSALGLSSVSPFPSVKNVESVNPPDSVPKSNLPADQVSSPKVETANSIIPSEEYIMQRPILKDCSDDRFELRRPNATLLYDLSDVTPSLTAWEINPPKRRRLHAPYSSLDPSCSSNSSISKSSGADPYEFSDEELGLIKQESRYSTEVVTSVKCLPVVSVVKEVSVTADHAAQTFLAPDQLQPSMNDLDNMFDTSSNEDSDDAMNCKPTRPSVGPPSGMELSRMFPTPPSLEPAVPSPSTTFLENSLLEIPCSPAALESLKVSSW